MLNNIQKALGSSLVPETWAAAMITLGQLISLYRDYEDGKHRDGLTTTQKTQLGLNNHALLNQFNMNYCPLIIGKMANRLRVVGIDARQTKPSSEKNTNPAQKWLDEVREWNRFDALQVSIHEAAIRDGATFLMVEYDNEEKRTKWVHEPAYDSETQTGVMVVYDATGTRIVAAIKIWNEAYTEGGEKKRVNIYRAGVIEKYITEGDELKPFVDETTDENGLVWNTSTGDETGEPLGIPVFHFANNKKRRRLYGQSELHNAVPLQDAVNWALTDMIMTSRLSAFPMRKAKGFEPEDELGPGDWVVFGSEENIDPSTLSAMDADIIPQGEIIPFLDEIDRVAEKMAEITRTPLPSQMGSSQQSGEALKERQNGLVEKVQNAQVLFGNVWEDVAKFSLMLHRIFGGVTFPEITSFNTRWIPAELRNDTDLINAAMVMKDAGYEKEFLRLMGQLPYLGYDDDKIIELMTEKMEQASNEISLLNVPGIGRRVAV